MDCNNFFVSCERLFRPDLVGKPVAVLSSNDGCIVARSQEVKNLGISMGVPLFQIQDIVKKHDITLFSSNFALYHDISRRVMVVLKEEFEDREVYSVDEAFFSVGDDMDITEIVEIRDRIMQKTGIPVSIGVAPTKTLAKVAGSIAKSNGRHRKSAIVKNREGDEANIENGRLTMSAIGVCVFGMGEWREIAKNTSCGSIWGIGRQTSAFLTEKRVNTVSDFLSLDRAFIAKSLGVAGERLYLELSGNVVYPIGSRSHEVQESMTSTRSFPHPIHDKLILMSALGYHTARVAEKLRSEGCVARFVTIIARGSRYGDYAHKKGRADSILIIPTDDSFVLTKEVESLFDTLYDSEIPYKKVGVILSGIEPKEYISNSLFHEEKKTEILGALQDMLNHKFGQDTVRQGITLGEEKWQERKERKSPDYTTRWGEIAHVKAI